MNIIVTGGAGFIGSNFVFHILKKYPDYRIICLDKLTYAGNLSTLAPVMDNPNFRFVKADICDREAVDKLFEEEHPDIVVNFAAESHVDRSIEDPGIFLQTNIIGTSVLMDAYKVFATDYFACSQKAGEFMFANKKFTVLKNAIIVNNFIYNENERNRLRKELGIEGKIVIGHAGRFCEQKNHKFLYYYYIHGNIDYYQCDIFIEV